MPMPSVLRKTIRDLRWQVFWYGFGLGLMAALEVYIYPSYHEQLGDFQIPDALKPFIGDAAMTSPEGFLSAEIFSWASILLAIFAIMAGTSTLAGEEANGTMDLLLSQPISRARLALEKMAAMVIGGFVIAGLVCVGWLASIPFVNIDIAWGRLLLATFNVVPITLCIAAFSMWAGAALPNRRVATGIVTAVAVASYFINYLAALVDILKPFRWLSVFYYYNGTGILPNGMDWVKVGVLLGLFVIFTALAIVAFQARDIGVRTATLGIRLRPRPSGQT